MRNLITTVITTFIAVTIANGQVVADAQAPMFSTAQNTRVGENAAPTIRQQKWLSASPEQRVRIAEELGEAGARAIARQRGWQPVFDGTARSLPQGPDQVWRSIDDVIHVVEAKGGSSPLRTAYGYPQGSPEWVVKSSERVLRSTRASAAEQQAAKLILDAAAKGKLQIHVVRTSHVLGEPTAAVLEQSLSCSDDASRLARSVLDDLGRTITGSIDDAARATKVVGNAGQSLDDVARAGEACLPPPGPVRLPPGAPAAPTATKSALRVGAKALVPVAIGVDAGVRVLEGKQIEDRFEAGEIDQHAREIEHARNAAGMAGGWGGAFVGCKVGAMGGGAAGSAVAPGPGTAIGGALGGVGGGVVGYFGGEAAAEAASEWTVNRIHAAGTTVGELAESTWDGAKGAARATADAASAAWNWTANTAGSAWDGAAGRCSRAWHWLTSD